MRSRSEFDANQALQSRVAVRQASQAWQEPSRVERNAKGQTRAEYEAQQAKRWNDWLAKLGVR